jgi:outer membrane protein
MKKVLLSAVAIFAFAFANAQEATETPAFGFAKGDVIVEGNLGFNTTNDKNTEEKTNFFEFNPKAGYFLSDKLAVGVALAIGSDKAENALGDTDKNTNFDAGVFGRYYFLDLGARFKTYGEVGVDFLSGKTGLAEAKYTGLGAGAGLGINYFVTKNVAINFALTDILAYNSMKYKDAEAVNEFTGNVNVFNNFFTTAKFGLTWKF